MIDVSKISANLIGVSLISSMMVFWLGSRYISVAHTQFSGASQLQRSVAPESALFDVARSLDLERGSIQNILVSSTEYDEKVEQLEDVSENSRALYEQAREKILFLRSNRSKKIQQRYSDESIDFLLDDLEDKLDRISISSSIIIAQIYIPFPNRDENVRMQLFDAYSNLISSVNNLRQRIHALPEKEFIGVLAAHEVKNKLWDISDSINHTSTLIEAYLQKTGSSALENHSLENLHLRIFQNHERANRTLTDLAEMVRDSAMAGVSSHAVTELKTQYDNFYRGQVKKLMNSVPQDINVSDTLTQWQKASREAKEKISELTDAALSNTLTTAESIKKSATISLATNTLIVLLCLAMAYATFRIAKKIQHQADHDDLTGLPNRRHFGKSLESLFKKTDILSNDKLVLMTLDLNGFKAINDTMGHVVGDNLLTKVADRLDSCLRSGMTIARMGGDEFAIAYIIKEDSDPYQFACKISESFAPAFCIDDRFIKIDISIGFSTFPDDASNLETLQISSDFAMFNAKQNGRKTIQPYDSKIAAQFENRISIEKDLSYAIENNELELYYQPQFNLQLNQVNAVEALIRWNHPVRGMVPPFEFIGVAEETGQMPAIGSWVLNEACRQAAQWNNENGLPIRVAVNVSVHQIMQNEFVDDVIGAITRHNISASCLELEITESVVMVDIGWVVKSLGALRQQGIRIALDDFGTGYSSLNKLQELPLDTLKIDRSFVSKLDSSTDNMKSMTESIASIAEIYGLETVAEGIETVDQLSEVNKLGIDVAQGYYYSKPLPKYEVAEAIININKFSGASSNAA